MPEVVRNRAGDDCGDCDEKIRPPDIVELQGDSADVYTQYGENTEIHTLKQYQSYLEYGAHISRPLVVKHKRVTHREKNCDDKVRDIRNDGNERTGQWLIFLFADVDRNFILCADLPCHRVQQEQIEQNCKYAHDNCQDIVVGGGRRHGENGTEYRYRELIYEHFYCTVTVFMKKGFHKTSDLYANIVPRHYTSYYIKFFSATQYQSMKVYILSTKL